jgi:CHASE2 domain-containing sensor protein
VNARAQAITLIVHGVIILALLAVVAVLAWHSSIGEQATVAILSGVLGLVGGSAGTLAVQGFNQPAPNGVKAVVNETKPPNPPEAS